MENNYAEPIPRYGLRIIKLTGLAEIPWNEDFHENLNHTTKLAMFREIDALMNKGVDTFNVPRVNINSDIREIAHAMSLLHSRDAYSTIEDGH